MCARLVKEIMDQVCKSGLRSDLREKYDYGSDPKKKLGSASDMKTALNFSLSMI